MRVPSHRQWIPYAHTVLVWILACTRLFSQSAGKENSAGYIPIISGGAGYVHNVTGGGPILEPQVDPVLLVPFGRHVLLESRTDFTGFFVRENFTSGPVQGQGVHGCGIRATGLARGHPRHRGGRAIPASLRPVQRTAGAHLDSQSAGLAVHGKHRHAHQRCGKWADAARSCGANPGDESAVHGVLLRAQRRQPAGVGARGGRRCQRIFPEAPF